MNRNTINPEMCSGISWWKGKKRKIYLRSSIFMALIAVIFGALFFSVSDAMAAKDMVFITVFVGIFALVAICQFMRFLKMPSVQIEKCLCGQVVGTRRKTNSRKRARKYYIIADVNGKELEGRCLYETYLRAETGDAVVLFSYGKNGLYCVHRDMPQ